MFSILLAGIWPIIGKLSVGAVIIGASLAWFFLAPAILGFKKTALWVAATTAVVLASYSIGVLDEKHRNTARENAVAAREEAVSNSERDAIDSRIKLEPKRLRNGTKLDTDDRG